MKTFRPALAALELTLLGPAVLFMAALVVRSLQPLQFEPAHTAQRIVDWYAARTHLGLWIFLIGLPLFVLLTGYISLLRSWLSDPALRASAAACALTMRRHGAMLLLALSTATSAGILAIVALHLITG